MKKGLIQNEETKIRVKSGKIIDVLLSMSKINLEGQYCVVTFVTDITDRRRIETALRESEFFLKRSQEIARIGSSTLELSPEKRSIEKWHSNQTMDEIFGIDETYPRNAKGWYELLIDKEEVNRYFLHCTFNERRRYDTEYRIIRPVDGEMRWISTAGELEFDDAGNPIRMIGTVQDITERKRAEEALRNSEAAFRSLFDASPIGVALILNRNFQKVNSNMCRMTGYTEEELLGNYTRMLYSDDESYINVENQLYSQLDRDGIGMIETKLLRKDGSPIHVYICISSTNPDLPHSEANVVSTLLDITALKKAEAEKKRLQEELLQVQKMESIGRLAGGVAHDFNNLLTAIKGITELIMIRLDTNDKLYSQLSVVMQAAESAAELTGQLLAFSRKQIIDPKVLDLNSVLDNMQRMLARLIGENIKLRVIHQPGLYPILVDQAQLQQIIINLGVNARDAMPSGGTLILETANVVLDETYCRSHTETKVGEHVMFAITDTGSGMTKETQEHLFEPFFTTKSIGSGTGLGLAMVYGAVKQNGGSIEVYSETDKGTTFKIYFPKAAGESSAMPLIRPTDEMPTGQETILLVEDNSLVLEFSRSVLNMLGYRVLSATSGEDAVKISDSYTDIIDLLITDVVLTGIDGRELVELLIKKRPELEVLYNSGYTENAIVVQGVLKQGLNFIGKPFSAFAIARKIRDILGND